MLLRYSTNTEFLFDSNSNVYIVNFIREKVPGSP